MTSTRGPAQLVQRHDLEAGHPAGRVVPDRPAAEQREHLGDVVALGPHRARAPDGQPDRARATRRCRSRCRASSESASATPTSQALRRRDRLRVDGVEVAAGRQHVDQAAGRRAGRAGGDVTARPARAARSPSRRWCGQPRHHLGRGERAATPRPRAPRRPSTSATTTGAFAGSQPSVSIPTTSLRASASSRSTRRPRSPPVRPPLPRASPVAAHRRPESSSSSASSRPRARARAARRPGRAPTRRPRPARARSTASTRLTRASPAGAAAEDVQAVADLDVLDLAQVAVDVQHEVVELRRRPGWSSSAGRGAAGRPGSASRSAPARAGTLAGSSAGTVAYSSSSCSSLARSP